MRANEIILLHSQVIIKSKKACSKAPCNKMQEYKDLLENLGDQIRTIRKSKGLTQFGLALGIEADEAFISNIENGHSNVTMRTMHRIAKALGVDVLIRFE